MILLELQRFSQEYIRFMSMIENSKSRKVEGQAIFLKDLVSKNRSYRRFYQDFVIGMDTLRELVNIARICGSAANLQPLKYILSCDDKKNKLIFGNLAWAGYLKDWDGPIEGERPSAYIVILGDTSICNSFENDCGIAAQTILLSSVEMGLGGCMIGSINREQLSRDLNIASSYKILLVVALGKPKEIIKLEEIDASGDIKYWRDKDGIHHVPKRSLGDIIID
ncbi:MAG: nitroreductase family protein [Candidatus Hydrogenedentota bacterium]